jgi:putative ABC transport system permease protein
VPRGTVQGLFLLESVLLAVAGGALGLLAGFTIIGFGRAAMPGLPLSTPPMAVVAALAMCLIVGMVSGVAPARRAADLDPVDALRTE